MDWLTEVALGNEATLSHRFDMIAIQYMNIISIVGRLRIGVRPMQWLSA